MYRYIFVHNSYTLTFKILENSHTRTIHKTSRIIGIKLTIYREANDTRVLNKRQYIIILAHTSTRKNKFLQKILLHYYITLKKSDYM